jgi:hypothetical protein
VRRIVLVMIVVGSLAVPAGAQGSSIVYNDDGNVWLANADGSGQYQVTLDGDPTDPYGPPSQADDGTIVTSADSGNGGEIIRLAQNGAVLGSFVPTPQFPGGIIDSDVSPDGTKIAYAKGYFANASCTPGTMGGTSCVATFVASSSGADLGVVLADYYRPSWMSNTRLLTDDKSSLYTRNVPGSNVKWFGIDGGGSGACCGGFDDDEDNPTNADWKTGHLAALTGGALDPLTGGSGIRKYISLWDAAGAGSGAQPTVTPAWRCALNDPVESPPQSNDVFNSPTWRPDGAALAWEETNNDPNVDVNGEGIWIWNMGGGTVATQCANYSTTRPSAPAIPFASNPDFGPANNNPGPRPSPPPPPPPPGGGGGTPSGGSTGGASTGGQTTTQQQVVPPPVTGSGAADRVMGSLTVGGLAISFMAPGSCVPAGQNANLAVTSQLKNKKKKRLKFKIKQVAFTFDTTKQVDKSAPFAAAFPTNGLASGSRHNVAAAMAIKKPGKKKLMTKTLSGSISIC